MKITLGPLDTRVAEVLANRRGFSVDSLITSLLRREAAVEIANSPREDKPNLQSECIRQTNPNLGGGAVLFGPN